MQKIALPQKISFTNTDKPHNSLVTIEPCYPGYGITLGNAIRRILLSSLPGAAVIGAKITGASHEFTTLQHVKEDVLEIILNLKQLRIKMHTEEVVKLELDVHGEKEVKASDIIKNAEVEIINPELVLANITDMAGNLKMEIYVTTGRGYQTVDERLEKQNEIGYIEIDSIFSPVVAVSINVESVRVGKMTNWDKLVLDITTDGIINAEEAFNQSVEILIDQFKSLIGQEEGMEVLAAAPEVEAVAENTEEAAEDDGEKKKKGRPKKS